MPYDQHIAQINDLIEARPLNDEFTLSELFHAQWPTGVTAGQHQAFGAWFRRKVVEGEILRVDDIDIPTGRIHNIHYRRVQEGSGQAWVRMSLSGETCNWIDRQRGNLDRSSFLQNLIEMARSR